MRCHDAAAALVEAPARLTPELQAHLAHCEDCRTLAALHASAAALRLPQPPELPTIPREAVLREVRRRVIRRRASAGAVASLGLAALVLWLRPAAAPEQDPHHYIGEAPMPQAELGLTREPREDVLPTHLEEDSAAVAVQHAAERGSLMQLMGEVRGFTRRDLVVHDETYRPFGTLAAWLRPPDSRALEAPPFRTAVIPLYPVESL
ncbi:hypothetical protein [Pyxidicoccus xibeiensis]|uniref:hypothetical protein n=1 Tax=Pyxidicoccus xibeiensis TaxID=2906759 RepID=UPI0020A705CE|nr:hypothetical protein [Pyxidicoccus xibeiensis]MCP3143320.1 hypothetical protein [Pyxidicoccus xibeiensis]